MVFCRWGCEEEEGDCGEQHVVHFGILGVDYLGEGGFVDGEGEEDDWYMLDIWGERVFVALHFGGGGDAWCLGTRLSV